MTSVWGRLPVFVPQDGDALPGRYYRRPEESEEGSEDASGEREARRSSKRGDAIDWTLVHNSVDAVQHETALDALLVADGSLKDRKPHCIHGSKKFTGLYDGEVCILSCAFKNTASCLARWKQVEHSDGTWSLYTAKIPHSVHGAATQMVCACACRPLPVHFQPISIVSATACLRLLRCWYVQEGVPMSVKNLISPSKVRTMSKKAVVGYLQTQGVILPEQKQRALGHFLQRAKLKLRALDPSQANTYSGILNFAESQTRDVLESQNLFTQHTIFTIHCDVRYPTDKDVWLNVGHRSKKQKVEEVDAEAGSYICIVFSSENLLLNAYRQQMCGLPGIMCVDYTHRLNYEGFNMCMVGTISPSQHFKCIGFAVTSDETEETHKTIFKHLREEIEAVVAKRQTETRPSAQ